MNITFIADFKHVVYDHYLTHPKPMIEWKFNLLLAKNPNLVKIFKNGNHPLIRKYQYINEDDNDDGEN